MDTKKKNSIIKNYRGFVIAEGSMGHRFHYFRLDNPAHYGLAEQIEFAEEAIDQYWDERGGRIEDQEPSPKDPLPADHKEQMNAEAKRRDTAASSDFKLRYAMESLVAGLEEALRDMRAILDESEADKTEGSALDLTGLLLGLSVAATGGEVKQRLQRLMDILKARIPDPSQKG